MKFHHIKIENSEGIWKTYNPQNNIQKKIQDANNTYISLNQFINFKEHPTYRYQNKIIKRYGLIDIDSQDFNSKEEAVNYFNEILAFLQKKKIQISEINATNIYGGFQIIIHPDSYKKFNYIISSSLLREEYLFRKIDWKVMNDIKRVRRLAPSWNSNKECFAYPLVLPDCFENHPQCFGNQDYFPKYLNTLGLSKENVISETISLITSFSHPLNKDGFHALGMPLDTDKQPLEPVLAGKPSEVAHTLNEANDKEAVEIQPPRSEQRQGQAIKSKLPCHFLVKQISNSVCGSPNNYVPVLKFPVKPSRRRIKRLQKAFKLGDVYLFQNHQEYAIICPKTAQKEKLEKIYGKARSWKSLSELSKFMQNWFYTSNLYDLKERKSIETLRLLDFFPQEANGFYSYPHSLFLQKYHNKEYPNLIGTKPKVYRSFWRS